MVIMICNVMILCQYSIAGRFADLTPERRSSCRTLRGMRITLALVSGDAAKGFGSIAGADAPSK